MCPLGEKMAKIWLKLQENGEKKSQMAKVMAKEKYILARTLQKTMKYSSRAPGQGACLKGMATGLFLYTKLGPVSGTQFFSNWLKKFPNDLEHSKLAEKSQFKR